MKEEYQFERLWKVKERPCGEKLITINLCNFSNRPESNETCEKCPYIKKQGEYQDAKRQSM